MGDFCMPSLGADMEAGTLVEWRVQPGAPVKRGDIVALVETQKGIVEVEIWENGVVDRILVQPGAKVPVGVALATITNAREPVAAVPHSETRASAGAGGNGAEHVRASPAARQLAREHELDLAAIPGTGPHGAVTREDVARAVGTPTPAPTPSRSDEPPRTVEHAPAALESGPAAAASAAASAAMRRAIAAAMGRSKREIPHYYLSQDIEVGHAVRWLEERNAGCAVEDRIVFAALLLKATALALREVPELNGHFVDGECRPAAGIHVGVAISLRHGGLVAPAIRDTDQRPLADLMTALGDVVARARAGTLRSSEMSDPTVTVTNLGDQGADSVFGVIFPPQVAIVGFGALRERPWAQNGLLGVKPVVTATLSADHRASDGHRGARFLAAVARHLEKPEELG